MTAATAAWLFAGFSALQAVDAVTEDARIAFLLAPAPPHPDIVIVAVTEDTLDEFAYVSPIDRGFLAELVDAIAAHEPRAIGLDVILDRPSAPAADRALLAALDRHGARIVLAAPPANGASLSPRRRDFWNEAANSVQAANADLILSRRDSVVRVQQPSAGADALPSFAAALAARAGAAIPDGELLIPFRRARDAEAQWPFTIYEAGAARAVPAELGWFRDKIVIVGALLDQQDRFTTPLHMIEDAENTTPGAVIHAYQAAQLLDGATMRQPPLAARVFLVLLMAAIGVAAGAMFTNWGLLTLALGGAALAHLVAAFALFAGFGLVTPIVAPVLTLMFGAAGGAAIAARTHLKNRRSIDLAFRHYVSPDIVDEIMRRPEQFAIGGEDREISVLVTDLEGFTAMLGAHAGPVLGGPLNAYFDELIDAIVAHGGAVDKIVGDGVFALFGAPARQENHAERAVRCALALDEIGERFRRTHAAIGFGRTRIGISSGNALVGSFGGARRINYTAYGAIVNVAERLQAANKTLRTRILVSEATRNAAPDIAMRPAGVLALKGVPSPERAFTPCVAGVAAAFNDAFAALERQDEAALGLLSSLVASFPDDDLAAFHLARIKSGARGSLIDLAAG